jgi:hypothetical protein
MFRKYLKRQLHNLYFGYFAKTHLNFKPIFLNLIPKIMKNKFAIITLTSFLFAGFAAFAQEIKEEDNFAKHKAEIIANLNQEKTINDQAVSCVNAAQKRDDLEKCRSQKMTSMEALKQKMISGRKANLQSRMDKLDKKSSDLSQKMNKQQ